MYTTAILGESLSLSTARSRQQSLPQRALTYLIEDVPLRTYLIVFLAVVLACGWLYSCLTVHGHGVNTPGLGFLDGIFFSIVTVTSLGYGDIYPVGFSRVIAGAEVLFGLALMGIMIAKVTSRRLSYHVQRLFAADAQRRLDEFADRFVTTRASLARDMKQLGYTYVPTPDRRPPGVEKTEVLADFQRSIMQLHATSRALHEYFVFESKQHAYFKIVPEDSVRRVGKSLEEVLYQLVQLIISLPAEAKPEAINSESRQIVRQALTALDRAAAIVQEQCPDHESGACFRAAQETCQRVQDSHFTTPTRAMVAESPDHEAPTESTEPEDWEITTEGSVD